MNPVRRSNPGKWDHELLRDPRIGRGDLDRVSADRNLCCGTTTSSAPSREKAAGLPLTTSPGDRHPVEVEVEPVEVRGRGGGNDGRGRPDIGGRVVRAGDVVVVDVVAAVARQWVVNVADAWGAGGETAILLAGVVSARRRCAQDQGRRGNRSCRHHQPESCLHGDLRSASHRGTSILAHSCGPAIEPATNLIGPRTASRPLNLPLDSLT